MEFSHGADGNLAAEHCAGTCWKLLPLSIGGQSETGCTVRPEPTTAPDMGRGKDQDFRGKQIQQITEEVDSNQQGAFVPLYQQLVIESSFYGLVALVQYFYLG